MPAPKTASPSIESTVSSPSCGMGSSLLASRERPKKQVARMTPIIVMVAAAFLASGLRKAGTPSATASTPDSATAPEEKARMRANDRDARHEGAVVGGLGQGLLLAGDRAQVVEPHPVEPVADERHERHHVDVGGRGEDQARLLQPTEVGQRHQDDEGEDDLDAVGPQVVEGRRDGCGAGRDRHRDGEDVVDDERRRRDERRHPAEVLPRHDVGAAAVRVGVDGLAVAGDDDGQQRRRR